MSNKNENKSSLSQQRVIKLWFLIWHPPWCCRQRKSLETSLRRWYFLFMFSCNSFRIILWRNVKCPGDALDEREGRLKVEKPDQEKPLPDRSWGLSLFSSHSSPFPFSNFQFSKRRMTATSYPRSKSHVFKTPHSPILAAVNHTDDCNQMETQQQKSNRCQILLEIFRVLPFSQI